MRLPANVQRPLDLGGDAAKSAAWYAASDRKDWCTPDDQLALVRALAGARGIGLDPCSNPASNVGALVECRLERGENGLARSWRGHGLVFANPPYGRGEVDQFTSKARTEFADRDCFGNLNGDALVLLVPANVSTKWYRRDCLAGDATSMQHGRIAFRLPGGGVVDVADDGKRGSSTVDNLWVYFGADPLRFLSIFGATGDVRLTRAGARRLIAAGRGDEVLRAVGDR